MQDFFHQQYHLNGLFRTSSQRFPKLAISEAKWCKCQIQTYGKGMESPFHGQSERAHQSQLMTKTHQTPIIKPWSKIWHHWCHIDLNRCTNRLIQGAKLQHGAGAVRTLWGNDDVTGVLDSHDDTWGICPDSKFRWCTGGLKGWYKRKTRLKLDKTLDA